MNVERALISKVLLTQDIRPVVDARITAESFEVDRYREVFDWVLDFWMEHQAVPKIKTVQRELPEFVLVQVPEPYSYYIEEFLDSRRFGLLREVLLDAQELLEQRDSRGALEAVVNGIQLIATEVSSTRDVNLSDNVDERIKEYLELKNLIGGMRGIPTGFPTIDRATSGLQPEQLVTLVGLQKAGKSSVLLAIAKSVRSYGKRPLLVGFEMTNTEQAERYDAMVGEVSFGRLRVGQLTPEEEEKLFKAMRQRAEFPDFWMSADSAGASTVSGIAGKIEQYRPDVVFIDGAYLMQDDQGEPQGTPRALTNITRALKRLAQKIRLPIVVTTQALPSRYNATIGLNINSVAYSSSFAQDSDVLLGIEKQENNTAKLSIVVSRNSPQADATLHWDWETGTLEEMESEEDEEDANSPL